MGFRITHWDGGMEVGTARTDFGALLDELATADDEHGDVAVTDEYEWCVAVDRAGYATLMNVAQRGGVHLGPLDRASLIALMQAIADGRALELRDEHPWRPGYPRPGAN